MGEQHVLTTADWVKMERKYRPSYSGLQIRVLESEVKVLSGLKQISIPVASNQLTPLCITELKSGVMGLSRRNVFSF